MTLRPGSKEARELFNSSDETRWLSLINSYDAVLRDVAAAKGKKDLIKWDKFMWTELPSAVKGREPARMTLQELSTVMRWKLARGKMRPLQQMVDSNSSSAVEAASRKAFQRLTIGGAAADAWEGAIQELTALRGIGVATATAVLSALAPASCAFMADEVIEATLPHRKRDYSLSICREMNAALVAKAAELGGKWDAEMVGKALWVTAMCAAHGIEISSGAAVASDCTGDAKSAATGSAAAIGVKRKANCAPAPAPTQSSGGDPRDESSATKRSRSRKP